MSNVDHPNYYNQGKIEVIDIIEDQTKDPSKRIEDLEKAVWYINRFIRLLREAETE